MSFLNVSYHGVFCIITINCSYATCLTEQIVLNFPNRYRLAILGTACVHSFSQHKYYNKATTAFGRKIYRRNEDTPFAAAIYYI